MSSPPPPPAAVSGVSAAAVPAVSGGGVAGAVSAGGAVKICFNSQCKEPRSTGPRKKGWRLRSGEHAELCERCFSSFEQGTFCETFHTDNGGWRNCESCGKRLHCGCIVSAPAYMLLDGGGIDCVACARKSLVMAPKQVWSSPPNLPLHLSDRSKELPVKGRNQVSGQFPGQWRHAANLWNVAGAQSELHQRLAYEFDRPTIADKLTAGRSIISANEKKIEDLTDRMATGSVNHVTRDKYGNGTIGSDSVSVFSTHASEEGKSDTLRDSGHLVRTNDPMHTRNGLIVDPGLNNSGLRYESQPNSCVNFRRPSVLRDDPKSPGGFTSPFSPPNDSNNPARTLVTQPSHQTAPLSVTQGSPNPQNMSDPSGEPQSQLRNGRPRADPRARAQLLRYCPRITGQELQQISGDSNSQITPLFEKILSASDAGRIGRLVLPKKCAEAYFPQISHSEGRPLKVQDSSGNEWLFQFRFWPNNNSRMYVLEGVTPCIQSMQLQAGDIVTFSRLDPEGKLVMGYRKASHISPEQENQTLHAGNVLETPVEANTKNAEPFSALSLQPTNGNGELMLPSNTADQATRSDFGKPDLIPKNESPAKSSLPPSKRKGLTLGTKNKRLRIDHEDSIQLKVTWDAAQDLLRPPLNGFIGIVKVEAYEFEEYKEAPVLGLPSFPITNQDGMKSQWIQCEECSKWRRLPAEALLASSWNCSDNVWDLERSSCSAVQELSIEQLAEFLPIKPGPSRRSRIKVENDVLEVSDGLDTLANLAILGESDDYGLSSHSTRRHPRHRVGCTCIVCIQPPSGMGPRHKEDCICNVCLTVRRRFRTLKLRRERRDPDKDGPNTPHNQMPNQLTEMLPPTHTVASQTCLNNIRSPQRTIVYIDADDEESEVKKLVPSPLKTQIDLNIQPEREEEPSPVGNTAAVLRAFSHVKT